LGARADEGGPLKKTAVGPSVPRRRAAVRETYARAGVDIAGKTAVIDRIRRLAGTTLGPQVLSGVGFFGGMYEFNGGAGSVVVSSVDGVGTKIKVALAVGKHDTIGIDIVNHCLDDILACGARPLFFLDYIGTGKVMPDRLEAIVKGLTAACRQAGCALIGGVIAEMPDVYMGDDYDLVGFIVGVVEKKKIITGRDILEGDVVLGLPSSGLHTNGYTLARRILGDSREALEEHHPALGRTLGAVLLEPHRSYYRDLEPVLTLVKGAAHITGGGIIGNVARILPKGLAIDIESGRWGRLPIFDLIQERGNVTTREMYRVFNMGLGMILVCAPGQSSRLRKAMPDATEIGRVVRPRGRVRAIIDGVGYRSDKVR
jgi:phosphoribosylformylglycinamidine cyclo-ligase